MPPVLRVQVGSEATSSILLVDNATYVPLIRSDAACHAALGVLCVCGQRGRVLMGQAVPALRARCYCCQRRMLLIHGMN